MSGIHISELTGKLIVLTDKEGDKLFIISTLIYPFVKLMDEFLKLILEV